MAPMMYALPPKSHKGLVIAIVLTLVLLGAGAAFFLYTKKRATSAAATPSCAGVLLYSGKTVGTGTQYCAKPGTRPVDLPFVFQSVLVPLGTAYKFSMEGTTDANNGTGTVKVALSAPGSSISNLPATISKVTSFSVTS